MTRTLTLFGSFAFRAPPYPMLAVSRSLHGLPSRIEAPKPIAGPDEILVKVHALSVNLSDWE